MMKLNTKKKIFGISDRSSIEHVAIIMDGNGRWANKRGLNRIEGHRASKKAIREAIKACINHKIPFLSLFAFSTDNWKRPKKEITQLFDIFSDFLIQETPDLMKQDVKIVVSGSLEKFPEKMQNAIITTIQKTSQNKTLTVNICLDYSGKAEIVKAVQSIIKEQILPENIDEVELERHFMLPGFPPVDLMIRTSGEQRISNFMLWQIAYAELYFTPVLWPDFTVDVFDQAIWEFSSRNRRYGGL
ncbi:MAG: polyprenyl diphosphate synthase [Caldisericia bacterium]|nr:polyprenyl diphosphate synthase [Caldisericia bacterium]